MSANPHVVTMDTTFTWDHAPQRLGRGTILDVPPDSALLAAIGADKLIPLHGAPPVPQASEPAPEPAQEKAPAPRSPAKTAAAAKAGKDADTAGADPPDTGGGERM